MNAIKLAALLAATLLTAAEYLVLDHDAQQHVARYEAEAVSVFAPQG
ncbi:MAG TPA: hypothetical protein VMG33_09375 [Steroidobacteraceae bacterium]|nr:hypothetical protein [Steroidobacteraceae bacterium]